MSRIDEAFNQIKEGSGITDIVLFIYIYFFSF